MLVFGGVSLLSILILPILAEDCSFMCSFVSWLFLKMIIFFAPNNGSGSQARNGSIMQIRVPNKPAKLVVRYLNNPESEPWFHQRRRSWLVHWRGETGNEQLLVPFSDAKRADQWGRRWKKSGVYQLIW